VAQFSPNDFHFCQYSIPFSSSYYVTTLPLPPSHLFFVCDVALSPSIKCSIHSFFSCYFLFVPGVVSPACWSFPASMLVCAIFPLCLRCGAFCRAIDFEATSPFASVSFFEGLLISWCPRWHGPVGCPHSLLRRSRQSLLRWHHMVFPWLGP